MYNGLEGVAVKGTGLSGYVERSRVHIQHRPLRRDEGGESDGLSRSHTRDAGGLSSSSSVASINPLAVQRSHRENTEAASRLARHKARREVLLRVLHYKEQRTGGVRKLGGKENAWMKKEEESKEPMEEHRSSPPINESVIEREAAELYKSLMEEVERQEHVEEQKIKGKSAASFAAAFEVRAGHHIWDHARLQREKQLIEEQRREKAEIRVAERIKRLRQEKGEKMMEERE